MVWNLEEPITSRQTLELITRDLLAKLLTALQPLRLGLRDLHGLFSGPDDQFLLVLRLIQPTADERHLWNLLSLEWERRLLAHSRTGDIPRCLSSGVTSVRLIAVDTAPLRVRQETLFEVEPGRREQQAFRNLIERLGSRLGSTAVLKSQAVPDPQPELACQLQPWSEPTPGSDTARTAWEDLLARSRPLRLWSQPQPLQVRATVPDGPPYRIEWDRQDYAITRVWGPERIATGWWRDQDVQRDYYRVETEGGRQLWIYHCLLTRTWFLHGAYD